MTSYQVFLWFLCTVSVVTSFSVLTGSYSTTSTLRTTHQQSHLYKVSFSPITTLQAGVSTDTITSDIGRDSKFSTESIKSGEASRPKVGIVTLLLPQNANTLISKFGSLSPYGNPTLLEAAEHLCRKIIWFSDDTLDTTIIQIPQDKNYDSIKDELTAMQDDTANSLIAFQINDSDDLAFLKEIFQIRTNKHKDSAKMCHFTLDCAETLPSLVASFDSCAPSISSTVAPWTEDASGKRMKEQMDGLFDRWTSDDFAVALMLFFNQFSGSTIDWVKYSIDATWEKGPVQNAQEFVSMVSKCGDCIAKCVADEECKECLDALTAVDTRDQVASYRTIVSYESELLRDFSFCILQKNNIFNCDATIPTMPKVQPLKTWRGKELTMKAARSILIGHLDDSDAPEGGLKTDISWKVAAGANVAYDQFPSQNQIFYESANGRSLWYDPVFRVETIDGRNVWCKRHYRVRDGKIPGTFYFSVLDNGVTSNEFWTVIAAADDLSWIIFHYAGAAGAVGQRYLGGLLCTANGELPSNIEELWPLLKSAGIEPWELFTVDNSMSPGAIEAGPPPLDFFRKNVILQKEENKGGK